MNKAAPAMEVEGKRLAGGDAPLTHAGTVCNDCDTLPIVGLRFKCGHCKTFNLCAQCYELGHERHYHGQHVFLLLHKILFYPEGECLLPPDLYEPRISFINLPTLDPLERFFPSEETRHSEWGQQHSALTTYSFDPTQRKEPAASRSPLARKLMKPSSQKKEDPIFSPTFTFGSTEQTPFNMPTFGFGGTVEEVAMDEMQ
jgi:hypothetical protein